MFDEYGMEAVKQEKLRKMREKGRQEGRQEGEQKAREESACNLLSIGLLTEEQIAQATGLTLERVKALKSE